MDKKTIFVVILVVILGVFFLVSKNQDSVNFSGDFKQVTIAEGQQPVFGLLYIADERGYFEEVGLDVRFKEFTSGRDALQSAIDGESDLATVYETPIVLQSFAGEELGIITSLHESNRNTAIVARRDRGIESPKDLSGKRIAVTTGTNGEFFLKQFLVSNGISIDDVNLIPTSPQDMVSIFESGSVDAVATWNAHLYNTRQSMSSDQTVTFYSDIYTEFSVLAGTKEFITENPDIMARLVKSIVKAEEFLRDHKEESIDIVVNRLDNLSEKTIQDIWDDAVHIASLTNVMLTIFTQEAEWLRDSGRVTGTTPDFRSVFVVEFLSEESPSSVTLLK